MCGTSMPDSLNGSTVGENSVSDLLFDVFCINFYRQYANSLTNDVL